MGIPSTVEAVEFRREQYGLNQQQWAHVLKIAPSHYSEFASGKRALPSRSMALAYAFGVPAECLFQHLPILGAGDIDRRLSELQKAAKETPATIKDCLMDRAKETT